jgi:hypothetical protein
MGNTAAKDLPKSSLECCTLCRPPFDLREMNSLGTLSDSPATGQAVPPLTICAL